MIEPKDRLTSFQIYKKICKELGLLFPLKESELVIRQNPIPNNLEFHLKGISKKELSNNLDDISDAYYKIFKEFGETKFYGLHDEHEIFLEEPREFNDRRVNLSTVLSILYVSGFRKDELYKRGKKYLLNK